MGFGNYLDYQVMYYTSVIMKIIRDFDMKINIPGNRKNRLNDSCGY